MLKKFVFFVLSQLPSLLFLFPSLSISQPPPSVTPTSQSCIGSPTKLGSCWKNRNSIRTSFDTVRNNETACFGVLVEPKLITFLRCDLSFCAVLIFSLACFGLFRFHLVSVKDQKPQFYSFTKQIKTEPKQLGVSVWTKTKKSVS